MLVIIDSSNITHKKLNEFVIKEVTRGEQLIGLTILSIVALSPNDEVGLVQMAETRILANRNRNIRIISDTKQKYYIFGVGIHDYIKANYKAISEAQDLGWGVGS
jgi:hypothetical protein